MMLIAHVAGIPVEECFAALATGTGAGMVFGCASLVSLWRQRRAGRRARSLPAREQHGDPSGQRALRAPRR